jgi:hypothetical protein
MTVACSAREIHRPHRADIPGDNRSDAVVESEVLVSLIGRLPGRVLPSRTRRQEELCSSAQGTVPAVSTNSDRAGPRAGV